MSVGSEEIKGHPCFAELDAAEIQLLCDAANTQTYRKGEFLIREGAVNHHLFLMIEGLVHIKSYGVKIAKLSAGSLLGEVSTTGIGQPIADVVAATEVTVCKFPVSEINKIAAKNQSFATCLHDRAMDRVLQ